jgi:hypothetical protein
VLKSQSGSRVSKNIGRAATGNTTAARPLRFHVGREAGSRDGVVKALAATLLSARQRRRQGQTDKDPKP